MTSPSSTTSTAAATCPACGTVGSGHFCANCGASLRGAACANCQATLSAGARFCHRCGTPAGAAATPAGTRGSGSGLPWTVAAIALLALISLAAGQRFGRAGGSAVDGSSNALPQAGLDGRGVAAAGPGAGGAAAGPFAGAGGVAAGRAPDISNLSPEERATRLFNRVIAYDEQNKRDSVQAFAPMAIFAYQMLPTMTTDQRYDLGRIGEVSGDYKLAKAQADTILAASPTHLLALALAARMTPAPAERAGFEQRLLAAEKSERDKRLPEYEAHAAELDRAIAEAKKAK